MWLAKGGARWSTWRSAAERRDFFCAVTLWLTHRVRLQASHFILCNSDLTVVRLCAKSNLPGTLTPATPAFRSNLCDYRTRVEKYQRAKWSADNFSVHVIFTRLLSASQLFYSSRTRRRRTPRSLVFAPLHSLVKRVFYIYGRKSARSLDFRCAAKDSLSKIRVPFESEIKKESVASYSKVLRRRASATCLNATCICNSD